MQYGLVWLLDAGASAEVRYRAQRINGLDVPISADAPVHVFGAQLTADSEDAAVLAAATAFWRGFQPTSAFRINGVANRRDSDKFAVVSTVDMPSEAGSRTLVKALEDTSGVSAVGAWMGLQAGDICLGIQSGSAETAPVTVQSANATSITEIAFTGTPALVELDEQGSAVRVVEELSWESLTERFYAIREARFAQLRETPVYWNPTRNTVRPETGEPTAFETYTTKLPPDSEVARRFAAFQTAFAKRGYATVDLGDAHQTVLEIGLHQHTPLAKFEFTRVGRVLNALTRRWPKVNAIARAISPPRQVPGEAYAGPHNPEKGKFLSDDVKIRDPEIADAVDPAKEPLIKDERASVPGQPPAELRDITTQRLMRQRVSHAFAAQPPFVSTIGGATVAGNVITIKVKTVEPWVKMAQNVLREVPQARRLEAAPRDPFESSLGMGYGPMLNVAYLNGEKTPAEVLSDIAEVNAEVSAQYGEWSSTPVSRVHVGEHRSVTMEGDHAPMGYNGPRTFTALNLEVQTLGGKPAEASRTAAPTTLA